MRTTNRYSNLRMVNIEHIFRTFSIGLFIYTNVWKVYAALDTSSSVSDVITTISGSDMVNYDHQQTPKNEEPFQSNRSFLRRQLEKINILTSNDKNNPIDNNLEVNKLKTLIKKKTGEGENDPEVHDKRSGISVSIEHSNLTCIGNFNSTQPQVMTDYGRREFFHNYDHLDDFLTGPGIENNQIAASTLTTNDNGVTPIDHTKSNEAVCSLRPVNYIVHFPHTMQQVLRCWSWWMANSDKQPILLWENGHLNLYTTTILNVLKQKMITSFSKPSNGNPATTTIKQLIIRTEYDDVNNDTIVEPKNTIFLDSGLKIMDYAMLDPTHAQLLSRTFHDAILESEREQQVQLERATNQQEDLTSFTKTFDPAGCYSSVRDNERRMYPSIGIVNRRYESRRSIVNIDEIYQEVFQRYPNSAVSVTYFEDLTVLQQVQYMMEHDIIVSPHGAQLVNLIYMPTYEGCSNIMEIFPENYLFGIFFGSLARAGGIRHSSMYVSANPPPIADQFQYVSDLDQREVEFCLPLELVLDAVDNMVTNWSECCSEYHSNNSSNKP